MAEPTDLEKLEAILSGGTTSTGYVITDSDSYLKALTDWLKVLRLNAGLSEEQATTIFGQVSAYVEEVKKSRSGMTDFMLSTLPFYEVLTSPNDIDRKLEIATWKSNIKSYNDSYADAVTEADKAAVKKAEQDYLNKATIEQSKADVANAEAYAKDLIKNVSNYSDDQLDKLLPTVIGTPREAILAELRNRGRMPISESARKINFRNVTKEQYDLAIKKIQANPNSLDADAMWIRANWDEKTRYDQAQKLLESAPNNPWALQTIQDVAGRTSGDLVASGDLTKEQNRALENYVSPERRAAAISAYKVPDQPELQKPYYAFLENLEPSSAVKTHYKEDIGGVYKEFQNTLVNGKGGEELRKEWWDTLSWANAGLLNPNEPVFENAAITGWAKKQGLTVEEYLETPPQHWQQPSARLLTDEDKKNWQTAQEFKRGFDIQGQQANQDYLTGLKKKKDPWIDFLDKYDWGASPSQRGFYPSTLAPMATWRR